MFNDKNKTPEEKQQLSVATQKLHTLLTQLEENKLLSDLSETHYEQIKSYEKKFRNSNPIQENDFSEFMRLLCTLSDQKMPQPDRLEQLYKGYCDSGSLHSDFTQLCSNAKPKDDHARSQIYSVIKISAEQKEINKVTSELNEINKVTSELNELCSLVKSRALTGRLLPHSEEINNYETKFNSMNRISENDFSEFIQLLYTSSARNVPQSDKLKTLYKAYCNSENLHTKLVELCHDAKPKLETHFVIPPKYH